MKRPKNTVFAAVPLHELLRPRDHALRPALQPAVATEERASAEPADQPVAEVVADDRGGGCDRDHLRDVVVALRREHAEEDQRCLARERNPERFEHHHDEEERQPVVGEEVCHAAILGALDRVSRDEGRCNARDSAGGTQSRPRARDRREARGGGLRGRRRARRGRRGVVPRRHLRRGRRDARLAVGGGRRRQGAQARRRGNRAAARRPGADRLPRPSGRPRRRRTARSREA